MTKAVSFAYASDQPGQPSLNDQLAACRAHARAQGYTVVGEFNEIEEADHPASGAALEAVRNAVANDGATVILAYQPNDVLRERLSALGAPVESAAAAAGDAASQGLLT